MQVKRNYITFSAHKIYFTETHLDRALAWISCERSACNKYLHQWIAFSVYVKWLGDIWHLKTSYANSSYVKIFIWNSCEVKFHMNIKCSFHKKLVRHNWLCYNTKSKILICLNDKNLSFSYLWLVKKRP